uniref:tRNA (guanine(10)-N(2))-methyltransferase n=1 Tax=Auxenochlorella protothecoides TaxID=3075 RepID=A0A1D2A5X4_AUXPR
MRVPQENPDVQEQDGTRSGNEEHCSPSGRAQEASETHQCRVIGTGACVPNLNRYLVYFVHRHLEYRLAEVEAQAAATGIADLPGGLTENLIWERPHGEILDSPFWYLHLPGDGAVQKLAQQIMLSKVFLEIWGEGDSWEEMCDSITSYPAHLKAPYATEDQSFRFVVELWGGTLQIPEQVAFINQLEGPTQFKGRIDLQHPQHKFWVIMVVAPELTNGLPKVPARYYFGREVAASDRSIIKRYELPSRRYLGPTSMEAEMAFIMCNQAKVSRGSLVFDPFVGTGSILVAAAHRGAYTFGADIDMRVIKLGKKDGGGSAVNVRTNFDDYGLPQPVGLLRADLHRLPLRPGLEEVLDAIVCDPPYGVRAGGRKTAARDYTPRNRDTHIPATDPYQLGECLRDLLDAAARLLRIGGRLVYFLPAIPGYYSPEEVPAHPALTLVANCEQVLSTRYSRRLITMEKTAGYDTSAAEAYHTASGPPSMAVDKLHEHVYAGRNDKGADGLA